MNLKKLGSLFAATIIASLGIAQSASANYTAVHKWTDSATQKTYVYFPNVTSGQPLAGLTAPKAPKLKVVTLNNCGVGKVTKPTTSPILGMEGTNGATVNFASKTSGADPTCTADPATPGSYVSSWTGTVGSVLETPTAFYIKGGTAAGAVSVNILSDGTITSKGNACNFLRVTVSPTRTMENFKVGTTSYTLAALPAVTNPIICKKVGTSSVPYLPQ